VAEAVFPIDTGKVTGIAREAGGKVKFFQSFHEFCKRRMRSDLLQRTLFKGSQREVSPEAGVIGKMDRVAVKERKTGRDMPIPPDTDTLP